MNIFHHFLPILFSFLCAAPNTKDLDVFIKRNQESGFGFRVLGGEGPDQPVSQRPVYIGAIVPLGAAEKDGRLRAGDELLCIDGVPVKGKSHKQVLELMTNAARNGQVMLTVRRKLAYTDSPDICYLICLLVYALPSLLGSVVFVAFQACWLPECPLIDLQCQHS
uniref:PDZ domain-containing protein n=1 Tax=Neolamprologus brichardi TaxID=32507 RepID=A0A3Q4GAU3_NEOBR